MSCAIRGRVYFGGIYHSLLSKQPAHRTRAASWFSRTKAAPPEEQDVEAAVVVSRRSYPDDRNMTHNLKLLQSQSLLTTKRGYHPADDVMARSQPIVEQACGTTDADWTTISLENARTKYQVLSKLIKEFDHDIPNTRLNDMKTVDDAVKYFQTEVRETSAYEDLEGLDLPKNLSIMKEYHRFDPATDTFFQGRTAFPGRDTFVTSIKFQRKYKNISNREEKAGYADHYAGY